MEVGAAGFSWLGFASFTFSAFLESARVVYIQLLLARLKYNALEVLVFMGPPTAAVLLAASTVWEWDGLTRGGGFRLMAAKPALYGTAMCMGFAVNLSTAFAISATSSLTFKIWGCFKSTAVVALGCLLGDRVLPAQVLAYGVSLAGFGIFSWAKTREARTREAQARTARKAS